MRMSKLVLLAMMSALLIPALASGIPSCDYICSSPYPEDQDYCHTYCEEEPPSCIPSGGIDDTLFVTNCCSGRAVPGSTTCANPCDYGTTWASCTQICE